MDRRKFIAVGATALIAGCDGGDGDTETPTESQSDDTATDTATPGDEETEDPGTITPSGEFEATVTFESCTEFTVEAEEFSSVWAALAGGEVDQWEEGYSGSESFEASGPINSVTVYGESGNYEAPNPDAAQCREE